MATTISSYRIMTLILSLLLLFPLWTASCNEFCSRWLYDAYCEECDSQSVLLNGRWFERPPHLKCHGCPNDQFSFQGICIYYCPTGYTAYSMWCEHENPVAFDFIFDSIGAFTQDRSGNHFVVQHGSSPSYWPDYDNNDPIPQENRGLWYNGHAYSLLYPHEQGSKVMISPAHTWQAWIKPTSLNNGTLFEHLGHSNFKISTFGSLMSLEIDGNSAEMEYVVVNSWNTIGLKIWFLKETNESMITFYEGSDQIGTTGLGTMVKFDQSEEVSQSFGSAFGATDGQPVFGFEGFIYQITLYSFSLSEDALKTHISESLEDCPMNPTAASACLSDCPFGTFGPTCALCNPTCTQGCADELKWGPCKDTDCEQCTSFEFPSCVKCRSGKIPVNGVCRLIQVQNQDQRSIIVAESDSEDFDCLENGFCIGFGLTAIFLMTAALVYVLCTYYPKRRKQNRRASEKATVNQIPITGNKDGSPRKAYGTQSTKGSPNLSSLESERPPQYTL